MAWKIDKDYLFDPKWDEASRVGRGQGDLEGDTFRFRLRDEDNEVHYGGEFDRAAVDEDESPGGLYQLWQFGMADTGATDLELHRADALALGLASERHVDSHTREGWTSIYS